MTYGIALVRIGHPIEIGPSLAGAAGWFGALIFRGPIGLAGIRITGSTERTETGMLVGTALMAIGPFLHW